MRASASHTGRALRDYAAERQRLLRDRSRRCRRSRPGRPRRASRTRRATRSSCTARASTTCRTSTSRIPRDALHRRHRRVRLGQVHARLRHRLRRRASAATSSRSTPTRASSCSPRRARTSMRSSASRRRWPSSSARAAAGARARWRTLTEVYPLPAAALREARHAALPRLPACRSSRRAADAIVARMLREHRGARVELFAPLVGRAQGLLHGARQVGGRQGLRAAARRRQAAAHGAVAAARPLPRAHASSCRSATCCVGAKQERALRAALAQALDFGKGVVHAAVRSAARSRGPSPRSAPARAAAAASPSPIRACSRSTSKHGWCERCFGTGARAARASTPSRPARRSGGTTGSRREAAPCPSCDGQRLNPVALAVRFRDHSIAELAALPVARAAHVLRRAQARRPRAPRSPATCSPRSRRGCDFLAATSASATSRSTAPRRRSPAARRSASASPRSSARTCAASATCSTSPPSACIRATTACCSIRSSELGAKGNTLVVVEHDEDTIRRADHVIDLGPGAGTRGGRVVGEGTHRASSCARAGVDHRALPRARRCGTRSPRGGAVRGASDAGAATSRARAAQPAQASTCELPLGRLDVITGVSAPASRRSRATCCTPTCARTLRRRRRGASAAPCAAAATCAAPSRSSACSRSTRRRSARRRAPARPPTSASGTPSAGCSPARRRRGIRGYTRQPLLVQHRRRALRRLRGPGRAARSR